MKVAVCSSLQGAPEEVSPSTPLDCYRLSGYVYNRLADMYPQAEFELFNRDDFHGAGDAFRALREATVAWGADAAVHIHQDAGYAPYRGWQVIYQHGEATGLANELVYALADTGRPPVGTGLVQKAPGKISVLSKPLVSVLIEAGFYTSAEDESIGVAGWGNAIVMGISNYLQHHWGLTPEEEGEEEMPRFNEIGKNTYNCARIGKDNIVYIHAESAVDVEVTFYCIPYDSDTTAVVKGVGGYLHKGWHGANYKIGDLAPGFTEGRVTIASPVPLSIEVG